MRKKILITGGAGFIGSNLIDYLIGDDNIELIRVIDNLSNGSKFNLSRFFTNKKFEFIEGDIRNYDSCLESIKDIDLVSHQAALGSVPRSIEDPSTSFEVNIMGTLNILRASKENNVERVVMAFSSSSYGDSEFLPKKEYLIGDPLSPYAITKLNNEHQAFVFNKIYGLNFIGLRYFNVFGPFQKPNSQYAAVIPLFIDNVIKNKEIKIFGDGETSRDFTFVENVCDINKIALFTNNQKSLNQIYNVACGSQISLNELVDSLKKLSGKKINLNYYDERKGDIKHSLADISKAKKILNYKPRINFKKGIKFTYDWFIEKYNDKH